MTRAVWVGIIVILLAGAAWYALATKTENSESVSNAEDQAVRNFVTDFGTKLRLVPLLAPQEERRAAMDEHYSAYVAPALLASWYPEGADALGRHTSSPWPDRIEVVEVTKTGADTYTVEGNIIEVTSAVTAAKEAAAVQPVTLTIQKSGEGYLITKAVKGSYSELPQRQTIVGYWECLPHKDTSGPQTAECAFGIAVDQSDGHFAIDTSLMETYPIDYPTGTKLRVTGIVTPANQLSGVQKYDIDGIIRATTIEKL